MSEQQPTIAEKQEVSPEQLAQMEKQKLINHGYYIQDLDVEDFNNARALNEESRVEYVVDSAIIRAWNTIVAFVEQNQMVLPESMTLENILSKEKTEEVILPELVKMGLSYSREIITAANTPADKSPVTVYNAELRDDHKIGQITNKFRFADVRAFVLAVFSQLTLHRPVSIGPNISYYDNQLSTILGFENEEAFLKAKEAYAEFVKEAEASLNAGEDPVKTEAENEEVQSESRTLFLVNDTLAFDKSRKVTTASVKLDDDQDGTAEETAHIELKKNDDGNYDLDVTIEGGARITYELSQVTPDTDETLYGDLFGTINTQKWYSIIDSLRSYHDAKLAEQA